MLTLLLLLFSVQCVPAKPIHAQNSTLFNKFNVCGDSESNAKQRTRRSVPVDKNRLFADRQVNYLIDSVYSQSERSTINTAISDIEAVSCIKFIALNEIPNENIDYVHIAPLTGCFADFGRIGGRQVLSLSLECLTESRATHELLHSLGMWHEHQRWDRDEYIAVHFENIIPSQKNQFNKLPPNIADTLSLPYDFNSVMHYSSFEYSIDANNVRVIESKNAQISSDSIGGKVMSELDKQRLNKMYSCDVKQCNSPDIPEGTALVAEKLEVGSIVNYKCIDDSLTLVGSKQRLCRFDGQWSGSAPLCTSHLYHFCDFENDLCGWNNEDWIRSCDGKPSENTGPVVDHTFGTVKGHFVFTDSSMKQEGDKSSITTATVEVSPDNEQHLCIFFAYYLWGEKIGNLKVYLNRASSGEKKVIFEKSGNLEPFWQTGKFSVRVDSSQSVNVEFEANFVASSLSDFGIDDVALSACSQTQIDAEKYVPVE